MNGVRFERFHRAEKNGNLQVYIANISLEPVFACYFSSSSLPCSRFAPFYVDHVYVYNKRNAFRFKKISLRVETSRTFEYVS